MRRVIYALIIMLRSLCALADGDYSNDYFENFNRSVFKFNKSIDTLVFKPIDRVYTKAVPDIVRHGISNFFINLSHPVYIVNAVLQGELNDAKISSGRFVVNTVAGMGGFIDVASELDMPLTYHTFSETLGGYGLSSTPYLVLPLIGPTSPRNLVSRVFDSFLMPWFYLQDVEGRVVDVFYVVDIKNQGLEIQQNIEETALDEYVAMRSIFYQYEEGLIE